MFQSLCEQGSTGCRRQVVLRDVLHCGDAACLRMGGTLLQVMEESMLAVLLVWSGGPWADYASQVVAHPGPDI